jgi:NAD(P)-dependent dehydrogenase (short-subunit alcohol dehydrogenase family)
LASEWGQYGIRVNTISPGYIVTAMVEALFEKFPERREEWPKQNMLGRLSRPEEYRGAAAFLISDASSFMTGESSIPLFWCGIGWLGTRTNIFVPKAQI